MNRIVQVGDVFLGTMSGRTLTVTKVTNTHATLSWECHEWDRPLTPSGVLVESGLYTFIAGAPRPVFQEGDRVRTLGVRARVGRVARAPEGGWIAVDWKDGTRTMIRISDVKLVPPVKQQEKTPAVDDLMPGDRVRLKHSKKGGTVLYREGTEYRIDWDHRPDSRPERREDLVVLYAPRTTDAPLPAQKAIDEVDALREQIKAEVERLQGELRKLKSVKDKLKGVELH